MCIKKKKLFIKRLFYLIIPLLYACDKPVTTVYKLWHKATISFEGPMVMEEESTFLDYRLQVQFTHKNSGKTYYVPGFFAADGNAAQTSATAGRVWRVHFSPDVLGEWTYKASFRTGKSIAISLDVAAGESGGYFDGATGSFMVTPSDIDPKDNDFRAKGMLHYVGEHYLQYAGSSTYFIKGGAGSPENFLAYKDFDGTYDNGGQRYPALGENQIHDYTPHAKDWTPGDPVWKDSLGTEIIGAINYIAKKGLNAVYMLSMNVEADGNDIWPWTTPNKRTVFDVSKLAQWEIVFDHMDKKGIMKDLLLTETENENLFEALDGDDFAFSRKLYYREMIARFGHHLGLTWNLGEETGHDGTGELPYRIPNTDEQRKKFCTYIRALDPYDHLIVVHNWTGDEELIFKPLLGFENFDGLSVQHNDNYYGIMREWINASSKAGRKWVVAMDEPLGWEFGLRPDVEDPEHDIPRTEVLWPVLMAGGAGVDWYFGWQNNAPTSDLSNEDWRSRASMWEQTKIAIQFFHTYLPFQQMQPENQLSGDPEHLVFAKKEEIYAIYIKQRETIHLDLSTSKKAFSVLWYDPQKGGALQEGTVKSVIGGRTVSLGLPPDNSSKDWLCLVQAIEGS